MNKRWTFTLRLNGKYRRRELTHLSRQSVLALYTNIMESADLLELNKRWTFTLRLNGKNRRRELTHLTRRSVLDLYTNNRISGIV